jgi:hypothetical protein
MKSLHPTSLAAVNRTINRSGQAIMFYSFYIDKLSMLPTTFIRLWQNTDLERERSRLEEIPLFEVEAPTYKTEASIRTKRKKHNIDAVMRHPRSFAGKATLNAEASDSSTQLQPCLAWSITFLYAITKSRTR